MNTTTTPQTTDRETTNTFDANTSEELGRSRALAETMCAGFRHHDEGNRSDAVDAFARVDEAQFPHLDPESARSAAKALVDALWAKDDVETPYKEDGTVVEGDGIRDADWSDVRSHLARRAAAIGLPEEYAKLTTEAWREHKAGGDYWTPTLRAQNLEVSAATGNSRYPQKPSEGRSGPGPLAARYLVCVELHDMHTEHHWERAVEVLAGYFDGILRHQEVER